MYLIELHKNGKLKWWITAETNVIDNVKIRKNTRLFFDSSGRAVAAPYGSGT